MSRDDHIHQSVEQSWIVLDENGWLASRPATASPSRMHLTPNLENEEDDEDDLHLLERNALRRIGMDSNVREALELAERSLELTSSTEDSAHPYRDFSDEESVGKNPRSASRLGMSHAFIDESDEDKYNGRAPPVVGNNNRRGIVISTDSEHFAFKNLNKVLVSSRSSTPALPPEGSGDVHQRDHTKFLVQTPQEAPVSPASLSRSDLIDPDNTRDHKAWETHAKPIEVNNCKDAKNDEEGKDDGNFMNWMFGSNFVPLLLSHAVTLLVGFYIGNRRSVVVSTPVANSIPCPHNGNNP